MINPFIKAVITVLKQLGFSSIERKGLSATGREVHAEGVLLNLGIIGDKNGNVVYEIDLEAAKKISSTMMGTKIEELNDMAKSALSEMSNMLTAHSSTNLASNGISVDISVPTMFYGKNISVEMSRETAIKIDFDIDNFKMSVYVSMD